MTKVMFSLVVMFCAIGTTAQISVEEAFRTENAKAFDYHFHSEVEMYLPGKDNRYSKSAAVGIMTEFFSTHDVKSLTKVHSGSSRGKEANYYIGELETNKGSYRVYIYYDEHDNKKDIYELRIEKN